MGTAIRGVSKSFDHDGRAQGQALTAAMDQTGQTYEEIGKLFEDQVSDRAGK